MSSFPRKNSYRLKTAGKKALHRYEPEYNGRKSGGKTPAEPLSSKIKHDRRCEKAFSARFKNPDGHSPRRPYILRVSAHYLQNVINVHAVQLRFFARVAMILRAASSNSLKSLTTKNRRPAFDRLLQNLQRLCQTSCIRLLQNAGADFRNFFQNGHHARAAVLRL